HRSDGNRRVPQNPFAGLVNVAACGQVHHGVRAPGDAPAHLLDFLFDRTRNGAVTDVRVDLHQEVAPDDHGFGFRMIDVCRNDRAAERNFVANEFRSDEVWNSRTEGFTGMLELTAGAVALLFVSASASEIFANGDELHFRSNDAFFRVMHLGDGPASNGLPGTSPQSGERFQSRSRIGLSRGVRVLKAEVSVVLRTHSPAFRLDRIAAID